MKFELCDAGLLESGLPLNGSLCSGRFLRVLQRLIGANAHDAERTALVDVEQALVQRPVVHALGAAGELVREIAREHKGGDFC